MAVIEIAARCIGTATVVALALTGHGVFSYVAGQILYSGIKSLSLLIAGFGLMRPSLVFDIAEAGAVLRFGAFQMGERLVTYLAANVDYLIIGKFLGMRELGFYKIAYELVVAPLRMVNPIFGSLALPRFAKSQHDDGALREGFLATVRLLSMCTFPLLLGLCATGRVFIPVMYGPGWDRAVPIIWLLTLMGLCKILGNLSGSIIIAKGRVKVGLIWNCIIAAGNGAVFMLVVHSGVAAIAAAYSLLSIIFLVISFPYYYGSTIGLRLPEYFGSFMIPAFLSGAMAAIVFAAFAALRGARLWPPGELALLVTIGIAVYAAMTFAVMGKRAGSDRALPTSSRRFLAFGPSCRKAGYRYRDCPADWIGGRFRMSASAGLRIAGARPAGRDEWERACRACDYATFFHTPAWVDLFTKTTGGAMAPATEAITFSDGLSAILPMARRRYLGGLVQLYWSMPAHTFGGWVSEDSLTAEHARLMAEHLGKRPDLQWRENPYDPVLQSIALPLAHADFTHAVDLSGGISAVEGRFDYAHRKAVRKAVASGVTVAEAVLFEELGELFFALWVFPRPLEGAAARPGGWVSARAFPSHLR